LPDSLKEYYPGSGGVNNTSKATVRIQFEFDLLSGKILELEITSYKVQDQENAKKTTNNIRAKDLVLRDLGYFSLDVLESINTNNGYFLSRLDTNTNAYRLKNGKLTIVDFSALERLMLESNISSLELELFLGKTKKLKVRTIVHLVPESLKNKRLRKHKAKKGKSVQKRKGKFIDRAGLTIFVTNAEKSDLEASMVRKLYSLRWQVEIVFKVWKSIAQIDKTKKVKVERFEFTLYAKLIWIIVNWKMFWILEQKLFRETGNLLSYIKVFKHLINYAGKFVDMMRNGSEALCQYIESQYLIFVKRYPITINKKKFNLKEILEMLENHERINHSTN